MDLGIARVPEGVETPCPWGDNSRVGKANESADRGDEGEGYEDLQESLELFRGNLGADKFDKGDNLNQAKDT